jgi:hypothetical protein
MQEFPIVEVIAAIGTSIGGMWAMFRGLQNNFLTHLEKSEERMVELITSKNGHMERIAKEFNCTMRDLLPIIAELKGQITSIDERV